MKHTDDYRDNIEKLKSFTDQHVTEIKKLLIQTNQRYEPIKYIKDRPLIFLAIAAIVLIISIYPLLSVWFLACVGTGYPGYRIIRSMMTDRDQMYQMNIRQKEISEFMHKSIVDQKIIQIPIRHNSKIIQRSVIIRGELEDGISVRDPETGIQSKYAWSNIDLNSFYISYVKPSLSK